MATLKDISREIGLSVTQVSRALNGHADVSLATRERVRAAADLLNYHPNTTARKLSSGKSGIACLVMPMAPISPSPHDSIFAELVTGFSRSFADMGMQFLLHVMSETDDAVEVHRRLVHCGAIDGFVLLDPEEDDARIRYLQSAGVPFVVHGRQSVAASYPYFEIDNEGVGYVLTKRLIERGHRRIAFLNGRKGLTFSAARKAGYERALREAGIAPDPALHRHGELTEGFGLLAAPDMLRRADPPVTGVVCGGMLIAKGLSQVLHALDFDVPRRISVTAHDDELPGINPAFFRVPLDVTRAPLRTAWPQLAGCLSRAINGEESASLQEMHMPELVPGGSVGAPFEP